MTKRKKVKKEGVVKKVENKEIQRQWKKTKTKEQIMCRKGKRNGVK